MQGNEQLLQQLLSALEEVEDDTPIDTMVEEVLQQLQSDLLADVELDEDGLIAALRTGSDLVATNFAHLNFNARTAN